MKIKMTNREIGKMVLLLILLSWPFIPAWIAAEMGKELDKKFKGAKIRVVPAKKGKNVSMFLLDDAVYLARKGATENLKAATGDSADDSLAHLEAQGPMAKHIVTPANCINN